MDAKPVDTAKHSASACGARPFPPIARRVLVIGLDGATFDILSPLMAEGRMPKMAEAVAGGASGILRSTVPPITPAAWTTFLTGKQPGTHGIIDFERYDVRTNQLALNSTRCLDHVRTLWKIVGDQGLKVGSVNVPMTFPAVPVNGFLVSGFETPGPDSDFVYPALLKDEIPVRLTIVDGGAPETTYAPSLVRECGLEGQITIVRRLGGEDLVRRYASAEIAAVPSRSEEHTSELQSH